MGTEPSALAGHDCISWTAPGPRKACDFALRECEESTTLKITVPVRVSTTTPESALQAALVGIGLVQATTYQVAPHGAEGCWCRCSPPTTAMRFP